MRRCNKIKELDVSHTKVVLNEVVDEIILFLSSTLEKLSLPTTYSERTFSSFSQFDYYQLFKLGSMPKLKCLWSFIKYGMQRIMDLWEKQFPNVVFLCYNDFSCQSHCDYTLYCSIPGDIKYKHHIIVPNPNIAKSMPVDETIWEIPCKSIKLSELKEDESEKNKTGTNVPQKDCIELRGLPYEAKTEHILEFLGDHSKNIVYKGVHMVNDAEVIDFFDN